VRARTTGILIAILLAACSGSHPADGPGPKNIPAESPAQPTSDDARPTEGSPPQHRDSAAAACTVDVDCVASPYLDLAQAGGCCPAIAGPSCVAPVVTVAEAERRRTAWEAQCSAVRCAPSASCATGTWTPVPACRNGVCVDAARSAQ
jgi:hypothetical protein